MPVIVVGADTALGREIVDALLPRQGEVRAFVSDPDAAAALKEHAVKVAIGDVSDGSHVGGAALHTFSAVLIGEAATDDRERSFADTPQAVFAAWGEGLSDAGVQRAILVGDEDLLEAGKPISQAVAEYAPVTTKGRNRHEIAIEVAALDEKEEIRQET